MTSKFYFILCLLTIISIRLSAQCGITVNAGQDQSLCAPGGTVSLSGLAVGADIVGTTWSPTTGITNPNSLNTTASVNTTTTYTLTSQVFDPTNNLITNANFDLGLFGFTSDYQPGTGGTWGLLSSEGQFATATNANLTHNNFPSCTDHTGGGNMLVVNGSTIANENIWCQSIPVIPGTDYIFSVWMATIVTENPGILQFSINGQLVGSMFTLPATSCDWNEFNETWNSAGSSTAEICIVNQNTAGSGNDFAIDDLFFGPVCEQTDEVTITIVDVQANVIPVQTLACNVDPTIGMMLDGTASSIGANITYQWTTFDGNIVSGANTPTPNVNAPGSYDLTVTYNDGTIICTDIATVGVVQDSNFPTAFANGGGDLTCANSIVTISGSGSSTGGNITYQWTTIDGNIVGNPNQLNPQADAAGTYEILVTNTQNGCTATASITIGEDISPPLAIANTPGAIDCANAFLTLDGFGSSQGANFIYQWTTSNGNIIAGPTTLAPTIDAPGTYMLTVTNTQNGCSESTSVTVTGDNTLPDAVANAPNALDCLNGTVQIDGFGSSQGNEFTYSWTTTDGNIVNGANSLNPSVDMAGTYQILVTNTTTGCSEIAQVSVTGNTDLPIASANVIGTIDCNNSSLQINGFGSSQGNEFTYSWTTTDGNIIADIGTLSPTVNAAGTYQLEVINNTTGCSNFASVSVTGNADLPIASANVIGTIDCNNSSLQINGFGSSQGNEFTYIWTTTDGNIIADIGTLSPTVNAAGTYQLEVINNTTGCSNFASVSVTGNTDLPIASANVIGTIDCNNSSLQINGFGSSQGNEFTYIWTTTDGNIIADIGTLSPTVNAAGTYQLEVINNTTGCSNFASVSVTGNADLPIASANVIGTIDCNNSSLQINGFGSSQGNEFTYIWTTTDGNIIADIGTLSPTVNAAGTYQLEVINNTTGCSNFASVTVTGNSDMPLAFALSPNDLDCIETSVILDGTGSSEGNDYSYVWTTIDGNVVSDELTLTPTIDAAGTYQLEVINNANDCSALATVTVENNAILPDAFAASPNDLDCATTSVVLDGIGSSEGNDFSYVWTTIDGNIMSDELTLNPTINAPGTYQIEVINNTNGCSAIEVVTVGGNADLPEAIALSPSDFDCATTSIVLEGNGSSEGANFAYEWTTIDGTIVSDETTLSPTINTAGTYQLEVTNNATGCSNFASVTVTGNADLPAAFAATPDELNCNNTTLILEGDGSAIGADISYIWTTMDGNIVSGENDLNPTIDAAGTYQIEVTNTATNCTSFASILVEINDTIPLVNATVNDTLDCIISALNLNSDNSSTGANYSYQWTTDDGNISAGETSPSPTIDAIGTYVLTIIDSENGCTASDMVTVIADNTAPNIDIAPAEMLTCMTDTIALNATNSSTGNDYTYQWSSTNGDIAAGENTLMPTVISTGEYDLLITNTSNGCTETASIEVNENITPPIADAGAGNLLDCNTASVFLSGENSDQGSDYSYVWTTINGNILAGETSLDLEVNSAGTYQIEVTNALNGCTATDTVVVAQDSNLPIAEASAMDTLNCTINTVLIDASNSSEGTNYDFTWTTIDGNISANENTLMPTVDAAGTYTLTIIDTNNNCESVTSVVVAEDSVLPIAEAGEEATLNCFNPQLDLNSTGSSFGDNFIYEWTTIGGNIIGNTDEMNPEIDALGTYFLTITNTNNNCQASDEVNILENFSTPVADAGEMMELGCNTSSLTVGGTNTSTGANMSYEWTTIDGNIITNTTDQNPSVDAAGMYELTVLNTESGCSATSIVEITANTDLPSVDAGLTAELTCATTELALNGTANLGMEFTYEWTTNDGTIIADETTLNPTINAPGTYTLAVTNTSNNCSANANVTITQDIVPPSANAGAGFQLMCGVLTSNLDGSNSDLGNNISYAWTTTGGNILADENTLTPSINAAGIYTLTVTNTDNACTDTDEVEITQDMNAPIAEIMPAEMLTCNTNQIQLNAENSSQSAAIEYTWTTANGNFINGTNGLTPSIDAPGIYTLQVVNTANNCESFTSITIEEDIAPPTVIIEPASDLTCVVLALNLEAININSENIYSYEWTTNDGNIANGESTLTPEINTIGTYQLLTTNTETGCTATENITIAENTVLPTAVIATPDVLTCVTETLLLDGNASSVGANFDYLWTTSNGTIISGATTPTPTIDAAGDYQIEVTNTENGCTNIAMMEVLEDVELPTAVAGEETTLTCVTTSAMLNGENSSQGMNFSYEWTTIDGTIQANATTLMPTINAAGTYQIEVTNTENGCTQTDLVEVLEDVTPPVLVTALPELLTCALTETNLNANGSDNGLNYDINWTTTGGNIVANATTLTPTIDAAGTYVLTIINTQNGCEDDTQVIVNEDVTPPVVSAGMTQELDCTDDPSNLAGTATGSGNLNYEWTTTDGQIISGANTLNPEINAAGNYLLNVIDNANGCAASDDVTITQNTVESFLVETLQPNCQTETGSILFGDIVGGTAPYTYSIDGGENFQTTATYSSLFAGNYDLIVQDINGCEAINAAQINQQEELQVFVETQATLQLGDSYQLNAQITFPEEEIATIAWTPADSLSCSDCLTPTAFPTETTTYTVLVTSIDGCTATDEITLVVEKERAIFFPTAFSPNTDGNNDLFYPFADNTSIRNIQTFQIFDRWGESVFSQYDFQPNDPAHAWDGTLRGQTLKPAVFIYYALVEFVDGRVELYKGDVTLVR